MNIVRNSWREREHLCHRYRTTLVVEDKTYSVETTITDSRAVQFRGSDYLKVMWKDQRKQIMAKLESDLFDKEYLI